MAVFSLKNWNIKIGDGQPLVVIAGLNVLENLDLALEVGSHLKAVTTELGLPYVFKASFDKANRSSIFSYRGPGLEKGLEMLAEVKKQLNVPIAADLHEIYQVEAVTAVVDVVQIPAFLCRQTDLVVAAARATHKAGGLLHVKKGQFLAPWDCKNIVDKVAEATGVRDSMVLCERGTSFGYNNLVVDMLAFDEMKKLGVPVTMDATHAAQLPGMDPRTQGASTGGRREAVPTLAKSAVAAGADGIFLEFHPCPDDALCDPLCCLDLQDAKGLLTSLKAIRAAI
tara:strand:- start:4183 stop:5031 length:849 start_codon:yes stop_codon:yes gene_type:complete